MNSSIVRIGLRFMIAISLALGLQACNLRDLFVVAGTAAVVSAVASNSNWGYSSTHYAGSVYYGGGQYNQVRYAPGYYVQSAPFVQTVYRQPQQQVVYAQPQPQYVQQYGQQPGVVYAQPQYVQPQQQVVYAQPQPQYVQPQFVQQYQQAPMREFVSGGPNGVPGTSSGFPMSWNGLPVYSRTTCGDLPGGCYVGR